MFKEKKSVNNIRGYVTRISLYRALNRFLTTIKYRKSKFDIEKHQILVKAITDLAKKIEENAKKEIIRPLSVRDYPVLYKSVRHLYEESYDALDHSIGFSMSKEDFIEILQKSINYMIIVRKTEPIYASEQLTLF